MECLRCGYRVRIGMLRKNTGLGGECGSGWGTMRARQAYVTNAHGSDSCTGISFIAVRAPRVY